MGKKKIILDTNILISALGWKGHPQQILGEVMKGRFNLIVSVEQMKEIKRVLEYPKFGFTKNQKGRFLALLGRISTVIETKGKLMIIKEDPEDNMLLVAAGETAASYIVSGNIHLLRQKQYGRTKIITARDFLRL